MIRALLIVAVLPLVGLSAGPARATTVYKCTDKHGQAAYQDAPCSVGQRQRSLDLPDDRPAAASIPVASETEAPPAQPSPRPRPPPPALPTMYACIRATDGKAYESGDGQPRPYQVPFGMLGAVQLPLSQVYGPGGGGGASAPELNRGKVTSSLIANYYVWVQDSCRPLSRREPAQPCATPTTRTPMPCGALSRTTSRRWKNANRNCAASSTAADPHCVFSEQCEASNCHACKRKACPQACYQAFPRDCG